MLDKSLIGRESEPVVHEVEKGAIRRFVEALGVDPDDMDWQRLGWDWVQPQERAARVRLYAKILAARAKEAA